MRKLFCKLTVCLTVLILAAAVSCKKDENPKKDNIEYGVDGLTPLPKAVDVGLRLTRQNGSPYSVKLASFNLGASKEYEYGDYYTWGDTETYYTSLNPLTWKTRDGVELQYDWASYIFTNGAYNKINKYCYNTDSWHYWDGPGNTPDNLRALEPDDDAAHRKLGSGWRLPTSEELKALAALTNDKVNYKWEYITYKDAGGNVVKDPFGNDVKGWRLTQLSTGNNVFFPAAGLCFQKQVAINAGTSGAYWSSELYGSPSEPSNASRLSLNESSATVGIVGEGRFRGNSIRPVSE